MCVFIYIPQDFTLTVNDRMEPLKIEVFDEDVNDDDDSMGKVTVSIMDLVESKVCVTERESARASEREREREKERERERKTKREIS